MQQSELEVDRKRRERDARLRAVTWRGRRREEQQVDVKERGGHRKEAYSTACSRVARGEKTCPSSEFLSGDAYVRAGGRKRSKPACWHGATLAVVVKNSR